MAALLILAPLPFLLALVSAHQRRIRTWPTRQRTWYDAVTAHDNSLVPRR